MVNTLNAINGACGVPAIEMILDRDMRLIIAACFSEVLEIYKVGGITLTEFPFPIKLMLPLLYLPTFLYKMVLSVLPVNKKTKASLLLDLESGKRTEVEYLSGEIVRFAKQHNMTA
eukprot:UN29954